MNKTILCVSNSIIVRARDGHGSRTLLDPPRTRPFFKGLGLNFLDPSDPGPGLDPKKFDGSGSGSGGEDPDPDPKLLNFFYFFYFYFC